MIRKLMGMMAIAALSTTAAYADMHGDPLGTCVSEGLAMHTRARRFRSGSKSKAASISMKSTSRVKTASTGKSNATRRPGKLLQTEREVAADDPEFTSRAKVRLDAAMKTALDKYPGTIVKIEYEIESDGSVAYEFDIRRRDGKLLEVEVDAVTGKLKDAEEVLWQIGK
jgi:uncharacterized membrane protein YkoI